MHPVVHPLVHGEQTGRKFQDGGCSIHPCGKFRAQVGVLCHVQRQVGEMVLRTMPKRRTRWAVLLQKWPRSPFWRLLVFVPGIIVLLIGASMDKTSAQALWLTFAFGVLALILPAWMNVYVSLQDKRKSILQSRDEVLEPLRLDALDTSVSLKWLLPRWSQANVYGHQFVDKKLDAWLKSAKPLMIIDGGPLVGKTRMALEWADSLAPEWETGWLRPDKAAEAIKRIAAYGKNTVVLVDGVPPHFGELVLALSQHKSAPKIRVLLTVRSAKGLRIENPYAAAIVEEVKPLHLGPLGDTSDRERWLEDLCRHYADRLGIPVPPRRPGFVRELGPVPIGVLNAAAFAAARTGAELFRSRGIEEVLYELWQTEVDAWRNAPGVPGSTGDGWDDAQLERLEYAVVTLSLLEPGDLQTAVEILQKVPALSGIGTARLKDIAAWATRTYPPSNRNGLAVMDSIPRIIVVAAFLHAAGNDSTFGHSVLNSLAEQQAYAVIDQLLGAAPLLPSAAAWATVVIDRNPRRLSAAVEVGLAAAPSSPDVDRELADCVDEVGLDEDKTVSLQLSIPEGVFPRMKVALGEFRVEQLRARARENPGKYDSDMAFALSTLGIRLGEAGGRSAEALSTSQESVAIYRRLAAEDPSQEPALALALNNLAVRFSEAGGRSAEGRSVSEEAVAIFRRLAAENAGQHEPTLARALRTLAFYLREDAGSSSEALAISQESVTIYRGLAAENPAQHEVALARGLLNLGGQLGQTGGRSAEALNTTEEAISIFRRLAAEDPALHEPDLARGLVNLASHLGETGGRDAEALTTTEEAVTIFRRLTAVNPAIHEPDLALALVNMAAHLGQTGGRSIEGRSASQEAVIIFRRLASEKPALYESDLALALNTLGSHLGQTEKRGTEALATSQESVTIYRRLAAENPALYKAHLALALTNLAVRFKKVHGRDTEAVDVAQEAVIIYRPLAAENPALHEPDLALALNNLAGCLREAGKYAEAVEICRELLHIYKRLAQQDTRFNAPLARTQRIIWENSPLP
ncbi:tetratricopeptide repeat protein [Pseudarthrobacter equi]|uniref:tetratricopeptide repeat protein n=1 Tax=Pseudarthrobacter equi TaxID=728066 RepID=UPI0028D797AA|nr:tetratricopeptide repeat protein [Pseudarthrobacter equi]